jgi:hypothetical protein
VVDLLPDPGYRGLYRDQGGFTDYRCYPGIAIGYLFFDLEYCPGVGRILQQFGLRMMADGIGNIPLLL